MAAATTAEAKRILAADPDELFSVTEVRIAAPSTPGVDAWLDCARCGEKVMETRTRHLAGQVVCLPCFEAAAG